MLAETYRRGIEYLEMQELFEETKPKRQEEQVEITIPPDLAQQVAEHLAENPTDSGTMRYGKSFSYAALGRTSRTSPFDREDDLAATLCGLLLLEGGSAPHSKAVGLTQGKPCSIRIGRHRPQLGQRPAELPGGDCARCRL